MQSAPKDCSSCKLAERWLRRTAEEISNKSAFAWRSNAETKGSQNCWLHSTRKQESCLRLYRCMHGMGSTKDCRIQVLGCLWGWKSRNIECAMHRLACCVAEELETIHSQSHQVLRFKSPNPISRTRKTKSQTQRPAKANGSLPLNGRGRLGRDVVANSVDALHLRAMQ